MSLNRVAFNNFIEKAVTNKKIEFSEKNAGNIGPSEERILKEILDRGKNICAKVEVASRKEDKKVSNFVTLEEYANTLR